MLTSQSHLSYYSHSAHPFDHPNALMGDEHCDVCIIGGGITGCSAALNLAEKGYRVILLEAHTIGWGASGRNGGQSIFGLSCDETKLKKLVGLQSAQTIFDMTIESLHYQRSLIEQHQIDCDYQLGGAHLATKPRHLDELKRWQDELACDFNYTHLKWFNQQEVPDYVDSHRYLGGFYDHQSAHLHPLNYTLGLANAAIKAGVKIFCHSEVSSIEKSDPNLIKTKHGTVKAKYLILSGNAYLKGVESAIQPYIMPVGTYILATEPLTAKRAAELIPSNASFSDINFVLDYFRLSGDNRLLFGGEVSYSTFDPKDLKSHMKREMLRVFPQLADVKPAFAWGGHVGITINRAPHFGRLEHNVYFAHGFSGHGLALSGLAGKLISEALSGDAERFDHFAAIPHHPFPGGRLFRMPALVLANAWYRLRDLL